MTVVGRIDALSSSLRDARGGLRLYDVLINGEVEIAASSEIARRLH